jgi:hypothetical protein
MRCRPIRKQAAMPISYKFPIATARRQRMQFCSDCGSARLVHRLFSRIAFDLLSNFGSGQFLHCRNVPHSDLLQHAIKRLLPAFRPRMTCHADFA